MTIKSIDPRLCVGCEICVQSCPIDVIRMEGDKAVIQFGEECMTCYWCMKDCPTQAVLVVDDLSGPLTLSSG